MEYARVRRQRNIEGGRSVGRSVNLEAALEGRVQVDPVEQLLSIVAEVSSYLVFSHQLMRAERSIRYERRKWLVKMRRERRMDTIANRQSG